MKNLLIVLLIILGFALVIGLFSSNVSLIGDKVEETETIEGTVPSFTYSKTQPEEAKTLLCSYDHGLSDPSGGASSGYLSNEEEDYTMIGVSFRNLTPGKTYTLFYDIDMSYIQYNKPPVYYLRTGGLSSYQFAEVPISNDSVPYGEGYVTFVAETPSVEFFTARYGLISNSSMIESYHLDLTESSVFKLYGG